MDIQTQVESVLGALVKIATVELTKLFESRYRASVADVEAGRAQDRKDHGSVENMESLSTGERKRSIGVQVDRDVSPQSQLSGMCFWSFKCYDFLFGSMASLQGTDA